MEERGKLDELLRSAYRHGCLKFADTPAWPSSRSAWEATKRAQRECGHHWPGGHGPHAVAGRLSNKSPLRRGRHHRAELHRHHRPQPHEEAVMPILTDAAERQPRHARARRLRNDRVRPHVRSRRPSRHLDHAQRHLRRADRRSASNSPQRACRARRLREVVIPVNGPLDGDRGRGVEPVKIPGRIEQIRTLTDHHSDGDTT